MMSKVDEAIGVLRAVPAEGGLTEEQREALLACPFVAELVAEQARGSSVRSSLDGDLPGEQQLMRDLLHVLVQGQKSLAKKMERHTDKILAHNDSNMVLGTALHFLNSTPPNHEAARQLMEQLDEDGELNGQMQGALRGLNERHALESFYESTNGDGWIQNTNWCSALPLSEWYGVEVDEESGRVTALKLPHNAVTGPLPEEVALLTRLREVQLTGNSIYALPPEVGAWSRVAIVSLSQNQLRELPPEAGVGWKRIVELNLSDNQLQSLPSDIENWATLTDLNLSNNPLEDLGPGVGGLYQLRNLFVRDTHLTRFPEEAANWTALQKLIVSNARLTIMPSDEVLAAWTQLKTLDLNGNPCIPISSTGVQALRHRGCTVIMAMPV